MPRVIVNMLVNQAEQILEEEQEGFRSQRSTTELTTEHLRLLAEKHLEHQKELFRNVGRGAECLVDKL